MLFSGAGGRTRTGTPSLAVDFESTTSANSITPAYRVLLYRIRWEKSRQNYTRGGIFLPEPNSESRKGHYPYRSPCVPPSPEWLSKKGRLKNGNFTAAPEKPTAGRQHGFFPTSSVIHIVQPGADKAMITRKTPYGRRRRRGPHPLRR